MLERTWRLFAPNPLLKQDHLKAFTQRHVQADSPRRNTPQPVQQPVPVFGHPHSEKVFLDVHRKLPMFVCVHCLWSSTDSSFPLENSILVADENSFTSAPANLKDHLREICTASQSVHSLPFFPFVQICIRVKALSFNNMICCLITLFSNIIRTLAVHVQTQLPLGN